MTKDEALDLALEALENGKRVRNAEGGTKYQPDLEDKTITAIKQARALDKKADNARELGLDYEPVLKDNSNYRYDPPVAEPVGLIDRLKSPEQHYEFTNPKKANAVLMSLCQEAADALAAPVQERTDYEVHLNHCNIGECEGVCKYLDDDCPALKHADMKAKWDRPTPPAAQPAPVQDLPFGVGGGLVAIKTLLSRDPCVHANTAIEMIDAILKEHPAAQHEPENEPFVSLASVQEPVATNKIYVTREQLAELYPPPAAQRQWVGLTDEEMQALWDRYAHMEMMRAIEAKLKERNV
jgi:hypothetical protein